LGDWLGPWKEKRKSAMIFIMALVKQLIGN